MNKIEPAKGMGDTIQCNDFGLGNLDTGKDSPLHFLYDKFPDNYSERKKQLLVYTSIIIIFYIIPLTVAIITDTMLWRTTDRTALPFLRDFNVIFMMLVTTPVLALFIISEKKLITDAITSSAVCGILQPKHGTYTGFIKFWNELYRKINRYSYIIGIIVGGIVSYFNSLIFLQENFPGWQTTNNQCNVSGWLFVLMQIPVVSLLFTVYVFRSGTTIFMLRALVSISNIYLDPFHQDKSAGLKRIGKLGLRNQYTLTVVGFNLLLYAYVGNVLAWDKRVIFLLSSLTILYFVMGIFVFVGPLIPFRKIMLEAKRREVNKVASVLTKAYNGVLDRITYDGLSRKTWNEITRLQEFKKQVKSIPVWPFDIVTMKRFITSYILPPIAFIFSTIFKKLMDIVFTLD